MPTHKIMPGECISTLAERTGLPFDRIWNDPGNDALRAAGRDPNVLAPGDVVSLPQSTPHSFETPADDTYHFRVKRPKAVFRLRLQRNGKPLADEPYVFTTENRAQRGTSDGAGLIETSISAGSTRATLVLPERGEQYELTLGHLEPANCWRGAAQRLRNLGLYDADASEPDVDLCGALRHFQALRRLEVTGELDEPTIAGLQEAHGC
jgi:hypothetical protein